MAFDDLGIRERRYLLLVPFYSICDRAGIDAELQIDGDEFVVVLAGVEQNIGSFTKQNLGSFASKVEEALAQKTQRHRLPDADLI